MTIVPDGSIYYWMYTEGLKHTDFNELKSIVEAAGKEVRPKDEQNYWNGFYRSDLYLGQRKESLLSLEPSVQPVAKNYFDYEYEDYPDHPYLMYPEVEYRWVPCTEAGEPIIKFGNGCMKRLDAECMRNSVTLAENLKGTKMIVVDCDGDHDGLDLETIQFLYQLSGQTHTLAKPKLVKDYDDQLLMTKVGLLPASFHLTFSVDKVIPTMHFPNCHIDIIGNKKNSLRYLKNKQWNGVPIAPMTSEIWAHIRDYVKGRWKE